MLRLLGGFLRLNLKIISNLCDSFKRLGLPDIICECIISPVNVRQILQAKC